ncbi:MAG: HigA family addiction module antitoxin [Actinomycetota bacterium]
MSPKTYPYSPDYAVPPGETLLEVLEDRGLTQAELARRAGLSLKHVNLVAQGRVPISTEVALRLERVTGVPAAMWMNLETRYRERLARLEERSALTADLDFLDQLPIAGMVAKGLLTKRAAPVDRLREVLDLFGVANRRAWEKTWAALAASFRVSPAYTPDPGALAVWLRLGELQAADIQCRPWDRKAFLSSLPAIRGLTREQDPSTWYPELVAICARAGVAVVVVEELPGTRTHGATRWLRSDKALIQLSLRHRWADIFWFSFFHEVKHLLDEAKRSVILDGPPGGEQPGAEHEADRFAAERLIPSEHQARLASLTTLADVQDFADILGIHPGIVVGRLQHDDPDLWPHSKGNRLRQRLALQKQD